MSLLLNFNLWISLQYRNDIYSSYVFFFLNINKTQIIWWWYKKIFSSIIFSFIKNILNIRIFWIKNIFQIYFNLNFAVVNATDLFHTHLFKILSIKQKHAAKWFINNLKKFTLSCISNKIKLIKFHILSEFFWNRKN